MEMQNWVLCRIFLKRRTTNGKNEEESSFRVRSDIKSHSSKSRPVFYDFLAQSRINSSNDKNNNCTDLNRTPASSTSSISGITHLSSHECDEREESSSCNSLPSLTRNP